MINFGYQRISPRTFHFLRRIQFQLLYKRNIFYIGCVFAQVNALSQTGLYLVLPPFILLASLRSTDIFCCGNCEIWNVDDGDSDRLGISCFQYLYLNLSRSFRSCEFDFLKFLINIGCTATPFCVSIIFFDTQEFSFPSAIHITYVLCLCSLHKIDFNKHNYNSI